VVRTSTSAIGNSQWAGFLGGALYALSPDITALGPVRAGMDYRVCCRALDFDRPDGPPPTRVFLDRAIDTRYRPACCYR